MADANPRWLRAFERDIGLDRRDLVGIASAQGAVGTYPTGDAECIFLDVDGDDLGCAGTREYCDGERTDRAGPDDKCSATGHVAGSGHRVPGHAGRFGDRGGAQIQCGGNSAQHAGRDRHVAHE